MIVCVFFFRVEEWLRKCVVFFFRRQKWAWRLGCPFGLARDRATGAARWDESRSNTASKSHPGGDSQSPIPSQRKCESYTSWSTQTQTRSPDSHAVLTTGRRPERFLYEKREKISQRKLKFNRKPDYWRSWASCRAVFYTRLTCGNHASDCNCVIGQKLHCLRDIQQRLKCILTFFELK